MKIINQNFPMVIVLLFLSLNCKLSYAQEPNIFYSQPDEIKQFLSKKYKKIEIEIVKYRGTGADRIRVPMKSAFRTIEFIGDTSCIIIDKSKDDESDTTIYRYDKCGKLILKKGHLAYSKYKNRYKSCKLISREINETEVESSGVTHTWNLMRFAYDKAGKLEKELIYDFEDTTILKYSNEYTYSKNLSDSIKEYYYDEDGVKQVNRFTKYYYSSHLDSIHYYNFEFYLIDKTDYKYNASGKLITIIRGGNEFFNYSYNADNDPEIILEESGFKEYLIKYFE